MKELKPCPFCGMEADYRHNAFGDIEVRCPAVNCFMHTIWLDLEVWNTRPIKDSLRAELAALKNAACVPAECLALKRQMDECERLEAELSVARERIVKLEAVKGAAADLMEDIDLYEDEDNPRILALREALNNVG